MKNQQPEVSLFFQEEQPNDSVNNPFAGRKVVIEGTFHTLKRETIKIRIQRLGGEVLSGDVTKNVQYIVLGKNAAAEKVEKLNKLNFNGYYPKILREEDCCNIFEGQYEGYFMPKELSKDLRLTTEHYKKNHVQYGNILTEPSGRQYIPNPLYGKNLYLGQGIRGDKLVLSQMLGMLGIYSGLGLSDSTQIIVLSHEAFRALEDGDTHPELSLIQETYNRGLAQWYSYLLTTEQDLLSWIKSRLDFSKDKAVESVYNVFMASKES